MPTYVYETIPSKPNQQPRRFEVEQRMSAAALTHDPETGLPVRRVISGGLGFIGASDKASDVGPCGMGACGMPEGACNMPSTGHACHPGCQH